MNSLKVYNKKGFFSGVLWTAVGAFCLYRDIVDSADFLPQQIKSVLFSLLCLAIGLTCLIRAFSKSSTREDRIEEMDERNRLVQLRTNFLTLNILGYLQLAGTIIGILGFTFTKTEIYGFLFLFSGISITVTAVIALIATAWYEKHL